METQDAIYKFIKERQLNNRPRLSLYAAFVFDLSLAP